MEQFLGKVTQGDSLILLNELPNESIDLIVTDPPYGDGVGYGRNNKEILNNEDESINYKVLPLLYDKLKNGGGCYLFTNWKFSYKIQQFIVENTQFNIRMQLVIVKNNIGMGAGFRNQYELCLVLEKGDVIYKRNDLSNVLKMQHIQHDEESHPHQKGVELLKILIEQTSNENDIVLDCFSGSGSTGVACIKTKRQFIGFELEQKYVDIANKRIQDESRKLTLF